MLYDINNIKVKKINKLKLLMVILSSILPPSEIDKLGVVGGELDVGDDVVVIFVLYRRAVTVSSLVLNH